MNKTDVELNTITLYLYRVYYRNTKMYKEI